MAEDSRLYEVIPLKRGGRSPQRARTVHYPPGYSSPPIPPPPCTIPPIPPRNRHDDGPNSLPTHYNESYNDRWGGGISNLRCRSTSSSHGKYYGK